MSNAEFNRLTARLGQLFATIGDGFPEREEVARERRQIQAQLRSAVRVTAGIQSIHID